MNMSSNPLVPKEGAAKKIGTPGAERFAQMQWTAHYGKGWPSQGEDTDVSLIVIRAPIDERKTRMDPRLPLSSKAEIGRRLNLEGVSRVFPMQTCHHPQEKILIVFCEEYFGTSFQRKPGYFFSTFARKSLADTAIPTIDMLKRSIRHLQTRSYDWLAYEMVLRRLVDKHNETPFKSVATLQASLRKIWESSSSKIRGYFRESNLSKRLQSLLPYLETRLACLKIHEDLANLFRQWIAKGVHTLAQGQCTCPIRGHPTGDTKEPSGEPENVNVISSNPTELISAMQMAPHLTQQAAPLAKSASMIPTDLVVVTQMETSNVIEYAISTEATTTFVDDPDARNDI
jgi:hypothetical protein